MPDNNEENTKVSGWLSSTKHKAILASFVVFFLAIAVYFARGLFSKSIDAASQGGLDSMPLVEVQKIRLTNIQKALKFVGNLKPNEQVVLKSEVDAVIKGVHFFEGQEVKSGDLLISFDDAAAIAQTEEVVAKYMNAKAEYEMTSKLAKNKYISESELNKKEAEMKAYYAQIKVAKNNLEKHKVYAPFSGKVGLKEISIGEFMNRGRELLNMVDETPMKVDFKVPEMLIHNIRVGQYVTVTVDGVDSDFSAVIKAVDLVADKSSHSFIVRAVLDDGIDSETYGIYPGQFARVKLINDDEQKAILVPAGALVRSGDSESVYRVMDGAAIQTEVIVGDTYEGLVEIIGGVSDGDLVVLNGQDRIRDGMKVRISLTEPIPDENAKTDESAVADESAGEAKDGEVGSNAKEETAASKSDDASSDAGSVTQASEDKAGESVAANSNSDADSDSSKALDKASGGDKSSKKSDKFESSDATKVAA